MLASNSNDFEFILKVISKSGSDYHWANISETMHAMTNVSMKDIYEVIYDIS